MNPNEKCKQHRLRSFLFCPIEYQTAMAKYAKRSLLSVLVTLLSSRLIPLEKSRHLWCRSQTCRCDHVRQSYMLPKITNGHKFGVAGTIFKNPPFFRQTYHIYIYVRPRPARDRYDPGGDWPPWEDLPIESSNTVNCATSSFLLYICHPIAMYRPHSICWVSGLGHSLI